MTLLHVQYSTPDRHFNVQNKELSFSDNALFIYALLPVFHLGNPHKARKYHWVIITVAVVLLHPRGGSGSPSETLYNAGEVCLYDSY